MTDDPMIEIRFSRDSLPAMGAKIKFRVNGLATSQADAYRRAEHIRLPPAHFIENAAAAIAFQKRFPPFDGNQRDEKKAQVMVYALEPG